MAVDRVSYTQAYSQLIVRSWTSEEFFHLLENNPHAALAEVGLEVPADAKINLILVEATGDGKIEDQIARWEEGERTGVYNLVVAKKPESLEELALSDEALESVAGGDACCSCCPCTCCT